MSASYWVLISDELITATDPSLLPDGFRLTGVRDTGPFPAGSHWHLIEDDSAPAGLDGKRVELVLGRQGREGAKSVIIERRVLCA